MAALRAQLAADEPDTAKYKYVESFAESEEAGTVHARINILYYGFSGADS